MNVTAFPNDIFLLIIVHLSPEEFILCRRVSKQFHNAFTERELNRHLLHQHFPRAREVRDEYQDPFINWPKLFSEVASRYNCLSRGTPRSIENLAISKSFVVPAWSRYFPVAPWNRHLQFEDKRAPFHYPDTLSAYSDGLLIFPSAELQSYAIYDVGAGLMSEIRFEPEVKIVRRIRLHERVLVVEWCEADPFHQLNENEMVHRHFATAYDIVEAPVTGKWEAKFR